MSETNDEDTENLEDEDEEIFDESESISKPDDSEPDFEQIKELVDNHNKPIITEVCLDSHVLMNLLTQNYFKKDSISGVLLGFYKNNTLEITYNFPLPKSSKSQENKTIRINLVQKKMLKALKPFNIDNFIVGWYQTSFYSSFVHLDTLNQHFVHQKFFADKSVMLVLDLPKTIRGKVSLKAYRLSGKFMNFLKIVAPEEVKDDLSLQSILKKIATESLNDGYPHLIDKNAFYVKLIQQNKLGIDDIFVELPIKIRKNILIDNFLKKYEKELFLNNFTNLDLSSDKIFDDMIQNILVLQKDFQNEQYSLQYQQRKQREGKYGTENGLDLLLVSRQLSTNCKDISKISSAQMLNIFLSKKLNEKQQ